jgi:[methyl-Co(III) methanol-specific corrinoid protein]:coenzyme M methyltransferase
VRRQVEAGADVICVEDMSASLDLTSPAIYRKLILAAQQRLVAAIGAPVILHVCGSNTKILDLLAETGAALSLENRTDLAAAVSRGKCAVIGGVPPVEVLLQGSPDDVRRSALECLQAGVHILAPGCGVPPMTPDENLHALARTARDWNA